MLILIGTVPTAYALNSHHARAGREHFHRGLGAGADGARRTTRAATRAGRSARRGRGPGARPQAVTPQRIAALGAH